MVLDGCFGDFILDRIEDGRGLTQKDITRFAVFALQGGVCAVTELPLIRGERQLHRRLPGEFGGEYTITNGLYISLKVHRIIHGTHPEFVKRLLKQVDPTPEQLRSINQLRVEARMPVIEHTVTREAVA